MLFRNPQARRRAYDESLREVMSIARGKESRQWLSTWKRLQPAPTPAWSLPGLARQLGIGALTVKDESARAANPDVVRRREGERLATSIGGARVITCEVGGRPMSSPRCRRPPTGREGGRARSGWAGRLASR